MNTDQMLTQARELARRSIETNTGAVAALLAFHGFEQTGPAMVQHMTTGVTVAVTVRGYRISFHVPEAAMGLGMIDLPVDSTYGLVERVVLAINMYELSQLDA